MSEETIERIHKLYRSGLTVAGIQRRLNEDGVPTSRAGSWFSSWREACAGSCVTYIKHSGELRPAETPVHWSFLLADVSPNARLRSGTAIPSASYLRWLRVVARDLAVGYCRT
jgi:hypothetical protein